MRSLKSVTEKGLISYGTETPLPCSLKPITLPNLNNMSSLLSFFVSNFNIILSFFRVFQVLFASGWSAECIMTHHAPMYPSSLMLLDWNTLIMHGKKYNLSSVSLYNFLASFVSSFPLGSNIILRHSHLIFFKCIVMLSPIYIYVFHAVSFLQVSQNPNCISLLPHVCHKSKCNFIHIHKKLTIAQQNYMYSSCSKSDNKCQKYGQKKNSTP